jgi:hypothetical protein
MYLKFSSRSPLESSGKNSRHLVSTVSESQYYRLSAIMPRLHIPRAFSRSSESHTLPPPPPHDRTSRPRAGSLYQRRHKRHSWHQCYSCTYQQETDDKIDETAAPVNARQMRRASDSRSEGPFRGLSSCPCLVHKSHEHMNPFNRLGGASGTFDHPSSDFTQLIAISIAGILTFILAVGIYLAARCYSYRQKAVRDWSGKETGMDCYLNDDIEPEERKKRWPSLEDRRMMTELEASPVMSNNIYHDPSQKATPETRTLEQEAWRKNKRGHIRNSIAKEEEAFGRNSSPRTAKRRLRSVKGLNNGNVGEELRQRRFNPAAI